LRALGGAQAIFAGAQTNCIMTARGMPALPTRRLRRLLLGARRLRWRVARVGRKLLGRKRTTYLDERVNEYRACWEEAAKNLRASFEPLCADVWEIRRGAQRTRIANYRVQIDDPVTLQLAGNKPYCCKVARRHGIPIARHRAFRLDDSDAAWSFMTSRGGAFVVKPANRSAGLGVTMHVRNRRELENAAALASLYSDELMIETMVPAESCRLLYLDGELIHAVRRRGVRIVGDGHSTVRELLVSQGFLRPASDKAILCTLEAQALSLESQPPAGKEVVARYLPADERVTGELRTVYNECITALVCRDLARSLVPLVEAVGSRFAGVDLLTNDPSVPLSKSGGIFLELNTTPAMHHHYVGRDGPAVAVRILGYLLEVNRDEQRRNRLLA
jgi:D-alanine-D-alanine ligase-like ATP-grasp enzyme